MSTNLLDSAIKSLHIQSVLLRNLTQTIARDFEPGLGPQLQVGLQLRHRPLERLGATLMNEQKKINVLRFQYECGLRFIDLAASPEAEKPMVGGAAEPEAASGNRVLTELVAVFSVDYVEAEGASISEAALDLFARRNVGYHVWPYWRELVQSQAARSMLPLPVIPFYQPPND